MTTEREEELFSCVMKMQQDVAVILPTIKKLDKAVHGNGQPGLLHRMTVLETIEKDNHEIPEQVIEWRGAIKIIAWCTGGGVLFSMAALVIGLASYFKHGGP